MDALLKDIGIESNELKNSKGILQVNLNFSWPAKNKKTFKKWTQCYWQSVPAKNDFCSMQMMALNDRRYLEDQLSPKLRECSCEAFSRTRIF
jgi:hypothetical protein